MSGEDPNLTTPPPDRLSIPGFDRLELIGQGGSADVYRARERAFDRSVAIKVFVVRLRTEQTRRDFRRECTAAGRVSGQRHPNIVRVFSTGETDDGRPFLTMELMEGSYADRLTADGLAPEEVLRVGVALAGAVATAHRTGVLHRDIKPENVLISQHGDCALADFGVATMMSVTTTRSPLGLTLQHAAPEVLEGKPATERSDVYSLASTLHQLASGHPPFSSPGGAPFEAMRKTVEDQPPAIGRPNMPRGFEEALRRAMTRDAAVRTASAVDFGRELQQVMRDGGLDVPQLIVLGDPSESDGTTDPFGGDDPSNKVSTPTQSGRRDTSRRRPALVAAFALVAVLAVAAGVVAVIRSATTGADASPTTVGPSAATSQELVQLVGQDTADRVPRSIDFDEACVAGNLNELSHDTLDLMVVAGAGSRSSIDALVDALAGCRLDVAAATDVMLAGGFGGKVSDLTATTRDCVAADLADTGISVRTVAVRALTPDEHSLVIDRYVADQVARSTARCLDPGELSLLVADHLSTSGSDAAAASQCASEFIARTAPVDRARLGVFLVDESQFPESLRDAYSVARSSVTASMLSC